MPPDVIHYVHSLAWCEALCGAPDAHYCTRQSANTTCPACRRALLKPAEMPESALLQAVREAAQGAGYLFYHTYRSDRSEKGYPDVTLCKPGHPVFMLELKTARGKPTLPQQAWLDALAQCTSVHAQVVRPADLEALVALLRTA